MKLSDNAKIAIVGGGPAGSMAGFFLLELAGRVGLNLSVDLYEPRDFNLYGPPGCNMCAGVISENLVQTLAAEGIALPPVVVQRGIDAYTLHTSGLPPVAINTPADDLRIATVYRGNGPRTPAGTSHWESFDGYLLNMAQKRGVNLIPKRVTGLGWEKGFPLVSCRQEPDRLYDLLIGAVGVNALILEQFKGLGIDYDPPKVGRGFISEIYLGESVVQQYLGSAMHIFLLDIPGLRFGALIPKVEYVTISLLGDDIDQTLVERFMNAPEVRRCLPASLSWGYREKTEGMGQACFCAPKLNMGPARKPYGDRVVMIGDSAVSRLYKDGIGAAFITAKACVVTALFSGVGEEDFEKHYASVCRRIAWDNVLGRLVFFITLFYQKLTLLRGGMVAMVEEEKNRSDLQHRMSRVLWDTFTGSATYREIMLYALHPVFFARLSLATVRSLVRRCTKRKRK